VVAELGPMTIKSSTKSDPASEVSAGAKTQARSNATEGAGTAGKLQSTKGAGEEASAQELSTTVRVGVDAPNKIKFTNLQPMDRQFIGEETGAVWGTKVKYLSGDCRLKYQVKIKDGKFYDAEGNLFDTSKARSAFGGSGNAIFVMDESGNIYASAVHSIGKFHHSSFLSGKPVASAGEIIVEKGVVKEITRRSGHYKPTAEQLSQFLEKLNNDDIDLSSVNIGAGF
jgi:hypothetical protein